MSRRRLVPLALLVTALLAIVALAARGRPLSTSGGPSGGLPLTFWDYAFTTVVILVVLLVVASFALYYFVLGRRGGPRELKPYPARTAIAVGILLAFTVLLAFIGFHIDLSHLFHPNPATTNTTLTGTIPHLPRHSKTKPRHVQFRWEELVAVLGALLVLGAVAATRSRRHPARPPRQVAPEALAAALDESLDDLRNDPDLSRAIIAAYARMEAALAAVGLPRLSAETPLEYVERVLLTLDTSATAIRRLTDLFEWARFSQHEPEPAMRDEAVDALVAVRDELRAAEPTVA